MLNTKLLVPSVGFSVTGLDHTKFGFFQFQSFLFIVVIVIKKLDFYKFQSIANYCDRRSKKPLLRRLKNIGMASKKLYRVCYC